MFQKNYLLHSGIISVIFILFIYIYSFYFTYYKNYTIINDTLPVPELESDITISSTGFAWPVPGFHTITSYFGYRQGSSVVSSYHSGIDIGAPAGTYFVAICDGTVVNTGWTGAGRLYYYFCK